MNKITTVSEYQNILSQPGKHVIKVSASWCNPCKVLASIIDTFDDSIRSLFVEIDADEAEDDLVSILNVRNVPVLIFYNQDKEIERLVGAQKKEKILDVIENM